ncbi:MAG: patatin-like phospholipase family protein [Pseudomonadota bacterium]
MFSNRKRRKLVSAGGLALGLTALVSLTPLTIALAEQAEDTKIALVLSGGGARGGAHVGVLRILEQQGIKPDLVVGTSFGALVGSLIAAGYSADEIEARLIQGNIGSLFNQLSPRETRSFRRKKDDDNLLVKLRLRLEGKNVTLPSALVSGHRLRTWLGSQYRHRATFADLRKSGIEYRAVVTDLVDGTELVVDQGLVEEGVYASMALPGIMEPIERDGRILVDGGLVNNLPVSVAEAWGATHIIAIDVGTPFYEKSELDTSFKAIDQMARLITRGNTERTIGDLDARTVLLRPRLDGIATASFEQLPQAIQAGEDIARRQLSELATIAKLVRAKDQRASEDFASLENTWVSTMSIRSDSALSDKYLATFFDTEAGQPFRKSVLDRDIARLYGTELFNRISYSAKESEAGTDLSIDAFEKRGRSFIQFGLTIDEDFDSTSEYELTAAFTRTQLNRHGAEWQSALDIGAESAFTSELYQPFGARSQYFASLLGSFVYPSFDFVNAEGEATSDRIKAAAVQFEIGRHFGNWGRLSLQQLRGRLFSEDLFGIPIDIGFTQLNFETDTLDDPAFPTHGSRVLVSQQWARDGLGNNDNSERLAIDAVKVFSRQKSTFALWGTFATASGSEAITTGLSAGGFLNLSGFESDQLEGRHLAIARAVFYRRLRGNALNNVFDAPLYFGSSIEYGNVWNSRDDVSFSSARFAGSLFVGVNSIFGPVFVGVGVAENGNDAVYLSIGRPFVYRLTSTFD